MRYRRFGRSDLEVSEVGFGVWTLASDWWGRIDDKQGMLHAALDAGINFIDTAPVYGDGGLGEELLADVLKARRDEIVLTTKCGYDIEAERKHPGQSERPHDWRPESVREQLEASLQRLGIDHIDLYQLHNTRIEPILADALWEELEKFRAEGKVRELGVALGPAIGWVDEGLEAIRRRPIASLQTVFNVLEQEPGRTFAAEPNVADGRIGLISRVPHASDTLSGKITRDTVFPRVIIAHIATATTCSTTSTRPTRSRSSGKTPAARWAKPRSRASSPILRSRPSCPRASRSRRCASTRQRSTSRSRPTRRRGSMRVGTTTSE